MEKTGSLDRSAKSIFIISMVIVALYFFGNVLMPILFSALISIILLPFAKFWEKLHLSKGLAALITVLIVTFFIIGILIIIVVQSQEIVQELPDLMKNNKDFMSINNIPFSSESITNYINEHADALTNNLKQLKGTVISLIEGSFIGLKNTLLFLISCPIYIFFMLLYRDNVYRFIESYHKRKHEEGEGREIIEQVKDSLYQYLKGLVLVVIIIGVLTTTGLYFLGIQHALFFGIVAAILAPIPYIGVIVSALIPTILALLTKDSAWYAFGVVSIFGLVQFLEGNFITPRIMGNSININPLLILLSIVIFGSITGLLGIILTVPLLAVMKVIIDHYPHLKPWTYLFEDEKSD